LATLASAANGTDPAQSPVAVDVLVVGAGVTGIYQLYLAREAGFSVLMLEAGAGVGGTWYWNRYPGSRYDSESYTYGYFFSRELFDDWTWPEVFTGQAENERYFNHVVDRFDLVPLEYSIGRVTCTVCRHDGRSGGWLAGCCSRSSTC